MSESGSVSRNAHKLIADSGGSFTLCAFQKVAMTIFDAPSAFQFVRSQIFFIAQTIFVSHPDVLP